MPFKLNFGGDPRGPNVRAANLREREIIDNRATETNTAAQIMNMRALAEDIKTKVRGNRLGEKYDEERIQADLAGKRATTEGTKATTESTKATTKRTEGLHQRERRQDLIESSALPMEAIRDIDPASYNILQSLPEKDREILRNNRAFQQRLQELQARGKIESGHIDQRGQWSMKGIGAQQAGAGSRQERELGVRIDLAHMSQGHDIQKLAIAQQYQTDLAKLNNQSDERQAALRAGRGLKFSDVSKIPEIARTSTDEYLNKKGIVTKDKTDQQIEEDVYGYTDFKQVLGGMTRTLGTAGTVDEIRDNAVLGRLFFHMPLDDGGYGKSALFQLGRTPDNQKLTQERIRGWVSSWTQAGFSPSAVRHRLLYMLQKTSPNRIPEFHPLYDKVDSFDETSPVLRDLAAEFN